MADPAPPGARFWNRVARRYAARPIKDIAAYETMLADAAGWLRPSDSVFKIGCGTGGTAIRLAEGVARYTATDFSAGMIAIARAKPAPATLRFKLAAAENALTGAPFEAICAFNVLHLVDDLPGLLARLLAALRPGGLLITRTWCLADLGARPRFVIGALRALRLFPPAHTLSGDQLRAAIRLAGFQILSDQVFGTRAQNPSLVARAL